MRKLYSAQVARPLSSAATRPTRLGFASTAWCRSEDLIAVVSGCGAVSIFHADAPGEATVLVSRSRAPARHVCWRPAPNKPCMLVVSDAAARLTFWISCNLRVNVWNAVADISTSSVPLAIGWNSNSTALAAVLSQGSLAIWHIPDYPTRSDSDDPNLDSRSQYQQQDLSRRNLRQQQNQSQDNARQQNPIRPLPCKTNLVELFGGQLSAGTVAPGSIHPNSFAIVTISVNEPHRLSVWQVSIQSFSQDTFDVRTFSNTTLDPTEDGRCVACIAVPTKGMLFAVGDKGVVAKFFLKTSKQPGWRLRVKKNIERATEEAVQKSMISRPQFDEFDPNSTVNTTITPLRRAKRRQVYAFEVSSDHKSLVTSTAAGIMVWDAEKLIITDGEILPSRKTNDISHEGTRSSPFWGLCMSPASAAIMALDGQGVISAHSLLNPLVKADTGAIPNTVINVAEKLIATTGDDGLRGGWDIIASIASQGATAATLVEQELLSNNVRTTPGGPPPTEQLNNLRAAMLRIADVEENTRIAAKKLLDVAVDAIRQSAPDQIKLRLMPQNKDVEQITARGKLVALIKSKPGPTIGLTSQSLAAAPLADWIMVLAAVWLQKCAYIVSRQGNTNQMGSTWQTLGNMSSKYISDNPSPLNIGLCNDPRLTRLLRHAALAALFLLALEAEHGEPDDEIRYFRFEITKGAEVVAALWEVSIAWETRDPISQTPGNGGQSTSIIPSVKAEQIVATARAFSKHEHVAKLILGEQKLRVLAAERALGLHGSSVGAGYIMSCIRKDRQDVSFTNDLEDTNKMSRVQWCPHDLVTGRPLPPWAPLRRCVVSGLLAAEITQQSSDSNTEIDTNSPWTSKWAEESPFGGRWARVPSLDLDRYELLPSVIAVTKNRSQPSNIPNNTDPNMINGVRRQQQQQQQQQQAQVQSALGNNHAAMQLASQRLGLTPAQAAAQMGMGQIMVSQNGQLTQQIGGVRVNTAMANNVARQVAGNQAPRVQASPGMSTVSSTTDAGSTITKGGKKAGGSSGQSRRTKKRIAPDQRQASTDHLTDVGAVMAAHSVGASPTPSLLAAGSRANSNLDVVSTDTRSAITAATNASGGVDQDTSKSRQKRRKRTPAIRQNAAAVAAASNGTQGIGVGAAGMMASMGSEQLPPGAANALNANVVSFTDGRPTNISASKKHQNLSSSSNQQNTAAALLEAGAAAEAAAANIPMQVKQNPAARNATLLQGGLPANAMGRAAMQKSRDGMTSLGFLPNGTVVSAAQASPNSQVNVQRGQAPATAFTGVNLNGVNNIRQATAMNLNNANIQRFLGVTGADGSVPGLNNSDLSNVAGMYQLQNSGNQAAPQVGQLNNSAMGQFPFTTGMPIQTSNIHPHNIQSVMNAVWWKQNFRQGSNQGSLQSSPAGTNTSAFPGNVTASSDLTGNPHSAAMGQLMMNPKVMNNFAVGNALAGNGTGMINVGQATAGMNLAMGQPRTSAADSATSVPTRSVRSRGSMSASAASPNSQTGADMVPNVRQIRAQSMAGRNQLRTFNGNIDQSQRIWEGELLLSGEKILAMAIEKPFSNKQRIRSAGGWPKFLPCIPKKFKQMALVRTQIEDPHAQWCVKFMAVDANGNEITNERLNEFLHFMIEKEIALEFECNEPHGQRGTLFIFVLAPRTSPQGHAMIGVFLPLPELPLSANDDLPQLL